MKTKQLSISDISDMLTMTKALANEMRLQIITLLSDRSYTVNEIAQKLNQPLSTVATNIQKLEDAGVINAINSPGKHGVKKLCARKIDRLMLDLEMPDPPKTCSESVLEIPVGTYADCAVKPTCGIADAHGFIMPEDVPEFLFHPNRYKAQILWFSEGFVTYKVFNPTTKHMNIQQIELSFEACSEAPNYRNDYKSDISISINDCLLGVWTVDGNYGGRRGVLNPKWWSDSCSQYGELKCFKITREGTYLDNNYLSAHTLADIDPYCAVFNIRIEVAPNAKHKGGLTVFGKQFGDYSQDILFKVCYI